MNNPVNNAVNNTPTVDNTIPGVRIGRISVNFVSIPPEKRITLSATIPMNCAVLALWNWNPRPSLPKIIPTTRNNNKAGTPKR